MKWAAALAIAGTLFAAEKGGVKKPAVVAPARPVSFRLDVMPVFFRAGCNSGGCHGAAIGKDGFHLSLFGYDPAGDYYRITQQIPGRRLDLAVPRESLLLMKATGLAPHSGGRRFKPDSESYATVLRWIEAGAPDDAGNVPQVTGIELVPDKIVFGPKDKARRLEVVAKYSDGASRPVNELALYVTNNKATADIDDHGTVTPGKRGDTFVFARFAKYATGAEITVLPPGRFAWPKTAPGNYIDQAIDAKLRDLRMLPSATAGDEQFLRRVYLDLVGMLPSAKEHESFTHDRAADKRARLVDALLERPEFADVWAARWAETLKVRSDNNSASGTDRKAANAYYQWIRDAMARNMPLDQFVRAQISSTGSNLRNAPVNLYTMLPQGQYDAKEVAQDVAQVFTGVRVQCAQCHNHPFDRWTQEDYYGFVSFFTGVKRKQASEEREFYVYDDPNAAPAKHLLDGHPVPAKYLGGASPDTKGQDPRKYLADWLTAKDNTLFRENLANRIWAQFFGRGIIEPVDDVRITNPPSNRELARALGEHLAGYDFDARRVIRDICNSRAYQRSTVPNETNRDDDRQFSHQQLRRLRADVLLDSIAEATGVATQFNQAPGGLRAIELDEGNARAGNYFLKTFGECARASVFASDTRLEPTLAQTLHLVNGDTIETKLGRSTVVTAMLERKRKPEEIVDELFVRTLARKPSEAERKKLLPLVAANPGDRRPYDDVFWALINSTEFVFNH